MFNVLLAVIQAICFVLVLFVLFLMGKIFLAIVPDLFASIYSGDYRPLAYLFVGLSFAAFRVLIRM